MGIINNGSVSADPIERLTLVAVFAVAAYGGSDHRRFKPFNAALGETFDLVADGLRFVAEQVDAVPWTRSWIYDIGMVLYSV